jgi:GH25 family lysozyme M1 (1,4-beta-N-acetylmuramidase)
MEYVDGSSHQTDAGTVDLDAYWAAGHRYLMWKATEGTGYANPGMPAIARKWHSFGPDAHMGYYHWLYGTETAQAQHDWFWANVAPVWQPGDWLMTDFEDVDPSRWVSDAQHLSVLQGFNGLCDQHGARVDTYTGNWYLADLPATTAYLRGRPVVMSDYSNDPPLNPYGLTYVAHQFTSSATCAGMPGGVDCNRWITPPSPTEDDLSAAEVAQIIAHIDAVLPSARLSKIDTLAYQVSSQVTPAVADMRPRVQNIANAMPGVATNSYGAYAGVQAILAQLKAMPPGSTVDVKALAAALAAALPKPELTVSLEGTAK